MNAWRRKQDRGCVIVVRYADDIGMGFEQKTTAQQFLEELRERLGKFGLSFHPEKTRLIRFGRFAAEDRGDRGGMKAGDV